MTTNRFTTFFAEPFSGEFIAKSADCQINFHLKRHHKYTKTLTSADINQDICNPVLSTVFSQNRDFEKTLGGRPFYGYDAADVQRSYTNRGADEVVDFPAPRLSEGMSALDYGCGPGPTTLGFS